MLATERRRLDRLLEAHAEVDDVEEELDRPLVLAIPARRAKRNDLSPVQSRPSSARGLGISDPGFRINAPLV